MKIVTLTMNPAFDLHCYVPDFKPFHENLAQITDFEAGGKGVNISRALCANGVENTAVVVVGEENAEQFRRALRRDRMSFQAVETAGRIRENVTIHTAQSEETRISFSGFTADAETLSAVLTIIDSLAEDGDMILAAAGRIPSGVAMEEVCAFLTALCEKGIRIVIDSKSFSVSDLASVRPWLIKPNQEEISAYLNREISYFSDASEGAKLLCNMGIENVMVSLGGHGAMLVNAEQTLIANAPSVKVRSTIGAGDSTIAGFLAATVNGASRAESLRTAVAYGSAACLTEGTRPPQPEEVGRLFEMITVESF